MTGMHAVSPLLKAERDIQTINVSLDQFNTSEVVRPQGLPHDRNSFRLETLILANP